MGGRGKWRRKNGPPRLRSPSATLFSFKYRLRRLQVWEKLRLSGVLTADSDGVDMLHSTGEKEYKDDSRNEKVLIFSFKSAVSALSMG